MSRHRGFIKYSIYLLCFLCICFINMCVSIYITPASSLSGEETATSSNTSTGVSSIEEITEQMWSPWVIIAEPTYDTPGYKSRIYTDTKTRTTYIQYMYIPQLEKKEDTSQATASEATPSEAEDMTILPATSSTAKRRISSSGSGGSSTKVAEKATQANTVEIPIVEEKLVEESKKVPITSADSRSNSFSSNTKETLDLYEEIQKKEIDKEIEIDKDIEKEETSTKAIEADLVEMPSFSEEVEDMGLYADINVYDGIATAFVGGFVWWYVIVLLPLVKVQLWIIGKKKRRKYES